MITKLSKREINIKCKHCGETITWAWICKYEIDSGEMEVMICNNCEEVLRITRQETSPSEDLKTVPG